MADISEARERNDCILALRRAFEQLGRFTESDELPIDDDGNLKQDIVFNKNTEVLCQGKKQYIFVRNLNAKELADGSPFCVIASDSLGNHSLIDDLEPIQLLWSNGVVSVHKMTKQIASKLRKRLLETNRLFVSEANRQFGTDMMEDLY